MKKNKRNAPTPGVGMSGDKNTTGRNTTDRRKLLKAAIIGGGAITTAKHLPEKWSAPVIDSVLLPTHAETSAGPARSVTGVFTATQVGNMVTDRGWGLNRGIQYALLDSLISPANASHIVEGICSNDDESSPATIVFRINANNSVDVAVTSDQVNDGGGTYCGASTTYHPGTGAIDNVTVQLDDDEFLELSGLSANANQVTGNWATDFTSDDSDDGLFCSGNFTAPLGGTFPATEVCTGD